MKAYKNLEEIQKGLKEVQTSVVGTDAFMAKCFPLLIKSLIKKSAKRKGKPTKWQRHVSKYMKAGKSIKDASHDWKKKA